MPDKIAVTKENLHLVEFESLMFEVGKKSNVDGKKIEITYQVSWNGFLAKTALEQASFKQAVLYYNNHRPISDDDVMSKAEFDRRKQVMLSLDGKTLLIKATAVAERKKAREMSPMEIALMAKDEKNPEIKKALQDKLAEKQKEVNEAIAMIK